MTTEKTMTGRCLCGDVTFAAKNVETEHHACHCTMCRRWGGAPFFGVHCEAVNFEGLAQIARYSSSEWAERGFCKRCGSNLFYYLKPEDSYSICAGLFDDQSRFHLGSEIFIDQKPAGYDFAGDLPKMTEAEVFAMYAPKDE